MKKFFTFAVAVLCAAVSAGATTWSVIGAFTDWSEDLPMTEEPDGTFKVTIPSIQGEFKFRADGGWEQNLGCARGVSIPVTGNVTYPLGQNGDNLKFPETVENVTMVLDPEAKTVEISGLPTDMAPIEVPEITDLYFIGEPAGGWAADRGILMESLGEGKYSIAASIRADQYFSFTTKLGADASDWQTMNANRYAPETDGSPAIIGESNPMFAKEGSWKSEATGRFVLTVDINAMELIVENQELPTVWGIIGSFNNWSDDVIMTPTDVPDTYTVSMDDFSGDFKFRADRTWGLSFGINDIYPISHNGEYLMVMDGGNFNIVEPVEHVTFTINVRAATLIVEGLEDSAIDEIATETDEAEYFNLQGMRVNNPEKGIFIKVSNGKSTKVRF